MSGRIISEWPINAREILRVRLDVYQGYDIVDLRRWYAIGGGEYRPGRGGLTIAVRHLPALAMGRVMKIFIRGRVRHSWGCRHERSESLRR